MPSLFPGPEDASAQAARLAPRLRALADRGIYFDTSNWNYQDWLGSIYTPGRYATRGKFSRKKIGPSVGEVYRAPAPGAGRAGWRRSDGAGTGRSPRRAPSRVRNAKDGTPRCPGRSERGAPGRSRSPPEARWPASRSWRARRPRVPRASRGSSRLRSVGRTAERPGRRGDRGRPPEYCGRDWPRSPDPRRRAVPPGRGSRRVRRQPRRDWPRLGSQPGARSRARGR